MRNLQSYGYLILFIKINLVKLMLLLLLLLFISIYSLYNIYPNCEGGGGGGWTTPREPGNHLHGFFQLNLIDLMDAHKQISDAAKGK